jgi:hypothetical protein
MLRLASQAILINTRVTASYRMSYLICKEAMKTGMERASIMALFPGGKCFPLKAGMAGEVVATLWGGTKGPGAGPF